jgi:hypothetical protein
MSFERGQVESLLKGKHREMQQSFVPVARLLQGAAPVTDKLVRSSEWDRYVTILQGVIDRYKVQRTTAEKKLADPSITKDEDVRKLRHDIFIADVTMDTLRFAIELPAAILQGSDEATRFATEFETKNADSAKAKT